MEVIGEEKALDAQGAVASEPSHPGHSRSPTKPVWASLEEAVQKKTEGNAFYKEKSIRSAISRYHQSLLVLRGLDSAVMAPVKGLGPERPPLTPEQETLLKNTQVDCYNNLAACLLQKQKVDYDRVLEYSLRVLQWQPGNVKALYRAGVATLETGDAQAAKEYLTKACKVQPNDANVQRHLQRAEAKLKQELKKEKAMYQGMFSSSPKDGNKEGAAQANGDHAE